MDRTTTTAAQNLHRIVAVLLALADLAERASRRSLAVRCLVLWLLRSAETLARDHLAVLTLYATVPSDLLPFTHDSATEAIRLATSFRQLAAALATLAAESPASSQQPIAALCGSLLFAQLAATSPFVSPRMPLVAYLDSS